jgi:hypothetical protein
MATPQEIVERHEWRLRGLPRKPTGQIIVNGDPMKYWLPEGVLPGAIGVPKWPVVQDSK